MFFRRKLIARASRLARERLDPHQVRISGAALGDRGSTGFQLPALASQPAKAAGGLAGLAWLGWLGWLGKLSRTSEGAVLPVYSYRQ